MNLRVFFTVGLVVFFSAAEPVCCHFVGRVVVGVRGMTGVSLNCSVPGEHGFRLVNRRGKKFSFSRIVRPRFMYWLLLVTGLSLLYFGFFDLKSLSHGRVERGLEGGFSVRQDFKDSDIVAPPKSKHRVKHSPCKVDFAASIDYFLEPKDYINFTQFSLEFIDKEDKHSRFFEPRFAGHQTPEEREKAFLARNQTLRCGFIKGPPEFSSTGFDLDKNDEAYMKTCRVAVSSCIFGSSDFLRRPTNRMVFYLA